MTFGSPAYSLLSHDLRERILACEWKPGDQLPTERALAAERGLSIGTVRRALEQLVREGFCYRVQGKGTFVTERPSDKLVFYRMRRNFFDDADIDIIPGMISRDVVPASAPAAEALGVPAGTPCVRLLRTLHGGRGGERGFLGCSLSWFPEAACRRLFVIGEDMFRKRSIYNLLEQECLLPVVSCEEHIGIEPHFPGELLPGGGPELHGPCFRMVMVSHSCARRPVEYRESHVLGGEFGLMRRNLLR